MTLIKAPWTMTRGWIYGAEIYDAEGELVATCLGKTQEESENNASLIAAAPEILEALDSMVDMVEEGLYTYDVIDEAKAAIKKARGEE